VPRPQDQRDILAEKKALEKRGPVKEELRSRRSVRPRRAVPVPLFQTAGGRYGKSSPAHLSGWTRIMKVINEALARTVSAGISAREPGWIERGITRVWSETEV